MRRREFIGLVGGAVAWPLVARAQQTGEAAPHRVRSFRHSCRPAHRDRRSVLGAAVLRNAARLGDTEGGNLVVERYSAEGRSERFASLAAEVVGRNPDVIVSNLNSLVKAFAAATTTIPIVGITGDPIAAGLISSLAHPGGNLTGVSIDAGIEIVAKRLQILKEAMPKASRVSYLLSNAWNERTELSYREAGQHLGIALTGNFLPEVNDAQLRRVLPRWGKRNSMRPSLTRAAVFWRTAP